MRDELASSTYRLPIEGNHCAFVERVFVEPMNPLLITSEAVSGCVATEKMVVTQVKVNPEHANSAKTVSFT